jgi:biotin-(acetyl-CoA carboxylase) ligase
MTTIGKTNAELTQIANEALRGQPGCETASIAAVQLVADVRSGRNWESPNVALGDSLISDVDRAVITLHHQLGRKFHLLGDD